MCNIHARFPTFLTIQSVFHTDFQYSGLNGCNPIVPPLRNNLGFYLLVSRGNCSFIDKAIAAKNVGALGVVVYNSIEGIYQGNKFASDVDYECDNGMGYVDTVLDPVYSDEMVT